MRQIQDYQKNKMHFLFNVVHEALDGLVIPDLIKIINNYLPDRGLIAVDPFYQKWNVIVSPQYYLSGEGLVQHKAWAQFAFPNQSGFSLRFIRQTPVFDPFTIDWTQLPRPNQDEFTIIYQGEVCIVE